MRHFTIFSSIRVIQRLVDFFSSHSAQVCVPPSRTLFNNRRRRRRRRHRRRRRRCCCCCCSSRSRSGDAEMHDRKMTDQINQTLVNRPTSTG